MHDAADMRTRPPGSDLGSVLARIDQRRHELVLSDRATSLAAGLSADALRNIRRQFREGDQSGLREETKRGLARALLTSVEWLATGLGPEDYPTVAPPPPRPRVQGLVVVGQVAAGRWLEAYAPEEALGDAVIPFDPRYPVDWQYAFLVRGTSMNRVASDGDLLVCLDIVRSGEPARDGDVVVIERRRHGLHEVSARRITRTEHHTVFSYDSLDPKFINPEHPGYQGPLIVARSKRDETTEVVTRARALGVYRRL
jgi:SOS-response transcriptional repressor LexA